VGTARDPLLTQFKTDFMRTSKLKLQTGDYLAFGTSTWTSVSKETKAMAGHADQVRGTSAPLKPPPQHGHVA
jgi:hypothetical protein